jgi:hypothetical protein
MHTGLLRPGRGARTFVRSLRLDYGGTLHPDKAGASDSAAALRAAFAEQRQRHAAGQTPLRLVIDKPVGSSNRAVLLADAGESWQTGVDQVKYHIVRGDPAISGMEIVFDGVDVHVDRVGTGSLYFMYYGGRAAAADQFPLECGAGTNPYEPTTTPNARARYLTTQPQAGAPLPAGTDIVTLTDAGGIEVGEWGALAWGSTLGAAAIGNSQPFVHYARVIEISGDTIRFAPAVPVPVWQVPYRSDHDMVTRGIAGAGNAWGAAAPVRWHRLHDRLLDGLHIQGRNGAEFHIYGGGTAIFSGSQLRRFYFGGVDATDRLRVVNHGGTHLFSGWGFDSRIAHIDYEGAYTSVPAGKSASGVWFCATDQGVRGNHFHDISITSDWLDIFHVHEFAHEHYWEDITFDYGPEIATRPGHFAIEANASSGALKIVDSTFTDANGERTTIKRDGTAWGKAEVYDVDLGDGRLALAGTAATSPVNEVGSNGIYAASAAYGGVTTTGSFGAIYGASEAVEVTGYNKSLPADWRAHDAA